MLDRFFNLASAGLTNIQRLDLSREQWIIVTVAVFGVGLMCMRGFGSRQNY